MIRIINNRKIDLSDFEWKCYQEICRSYDRPNSKGEDLFVDLFDSDKDGMIVYLRPPSTRATSLEVYLFLCSVFQHQQGRLNAAKVDELVAKYEKKLVELNEQLEKKLK